MYLEDGGDMCERRRREVPGGRLGCMVLTDALWIDMYVLNVKCHVVPIHLTDVFLLWYVTAGNNRLRVLQRLASAHH